MMPKEDLGIRRKHAEAGKDIQMSEFKGFMTSEMGNMKEYMKEMKDELKQEIKDTRTEVKEDIKEMDKRYTEILFGTNGLNERVNSLEKFKTKIWSFGATIGMVASMIAFLGNLAIQFVIKFGK